MSSFFEKLKKGMEAEEETIQEEEKPSLKEDFKVERIKEKQKKKTKTKSVAEEKEKENFQSQELEMETKPIEIKAEPAGRNFPLKNMGGPEGEPAIDVFQTENELIVQSAIAGVKPEDLEISMEKDVISIKGIREKPSDEKGDYFTKECFWGPFSRKIITPVEADPNLITASMKEGILTIRVPKLQKEKKRKITVK